MNQPLRKIIYIVFTLLVPIILKAQDSTKTKLAFEADFRFRVEQDWKSKKSDGTFRDDRTRLRYMARVGLTYEYDNWASFGVRIRTGDPDKQQDPNLTLGESYKEFGLLPIAVEKVYAKFKSHWISAWVGKNTFPFEKQNELFWSNHVYPEGIAINSTFSFDDDPVQSLAINAGHFIISASGKSLSSDRYFQGLQIVPSLFHNKLKLYPSIYYFHKIPDIPDGNETFTLDYSIFNLGGKVTITEHPKIVAGLDYYSNLKNLDAYELIPESFKNQKKGFVAMVSYGTLQQKGDWTFNLTYAYLEKYAAVDYFAQNDWARWDYSSQGSQDGRLTNFKGLEFLTGYALDKKINIKFTYFVVDQIVKSGIAKETGNRWRLDFNIAL